MTKTTLLAGAASVDITPPPGLMMCGYAARTESATGTHDPLTARALVIGDTANVATSFPGFVQLAGRVGFALRAP